MWKKCMLFLVVLFVSIPMISQIDLPNNSVRFDASESSENSSTGFEMPAITTPSLSNTKNPNMPDNSDLGKEKEKQIDMQNGDGLMDYTGTNKAPKYFTKDKEEKPEYGKDQYLGDFKTTAKKSNFYVPRPRVCGWRYDSGVCKWRNCDSTGKAGRKF